MRSYKLNQNTVWSALPWQDIQMRIFMLQQQIYKSSKDCNIFLMHKWQNLLLNCNEIKLMTINIISNYILKYYSIYNSAKYKVDDKLKFFLFNHIYRAYNCNLVIKNLLELIKQHIIYLCIQTEWEAKFEPIFKQKISNQSSYLYQKRIIDSLKLFNEYTNNQNLDLIKIHCHNEIVPKYSNQSYLLNKLQSLSYINYCLQSWLDNNFVSNLLESLNYKILLTGIEWFNLKNMELKVVNKEDSFTTKNSIYYSLYNIYFIIFSLKLSRKLKKFGNRTKYKVVHNNKLFNKNISCLFYDNDYLCQILISSIKLIIYKSNLLNKWRIKKNLKLSQVIYLFIYQCHKFYALFYLFFNTKMIIKIKQALNKYLFLWIKKKYIKYTNFNFAVSHLLNKQLLLVKRQTLKHLCISYLSV